MHSFSEKEVPYRQSKKINWPLNQEHWLKAVLDLTVSFIRQETETGHPQERVSLQLKHEQFSC